MARDVKPVITLAVTNAASSDGSKLALTCANRAIAFTAASALSADTKTMTVTLTPQANAILAGDNCALAGDVTTTGAGGTAKTPINTSFSTYAAPVAKGLSLIAGTADSPGSKDGPLLEASMNSPRSMTRDAQGNIYVSEGCQGYNAQDHMIIRKISTDGTMTTVAGSALYGGKWGPNFGLSENHRCIIGGIAVHPDGNLYTYDWYTHLVQKITPQGQVTTVAGAFVQSGSADGNGATARFNAWGITADAQGNLYIADNGNHTIRKIDSSGNVTTYAGQAGTSGSIDGTVQNARFDYPGTIKFDVTSGKLYVEDNNGLRAIENGMVTTVIPIQTFLNDLCAGGYGGYRPSDFDIAGDGRIAVAFAQCWRVGVYKNKLLTLKLGPDAWKFEDRLNDSDGAPSVARFSSPSGVAFQSNGDLLISDLSNHNIKRYSVSANSVSLFAGKRNYWSPVDGTGSAAKFKDPPCMFLAKSGDIWLSRNSILSSSAMMTAMSRVDVHGNVSSVPDPVGEHGESCVMKVNVDGSFIDIGGSPQGVRHRRATGAIISVLATLSATDSVLPYWHQSVEDSNGDLFFFNFNGGILKYSSGVVSLFAQVDPKKTNGWIHGMAMLPTGDLIVSTNESGISKISPTGVVTTLVPASYTLQPQDGDVGAVGIGCGPLAVDPKGAIYILNATGSVIRRIFDGKVTAVAGTWWIDETEVGAGPGKIHAPRGLAYDAASNSLVILADDALLRAQLP